MIAGTFIFDLPQILLSAWRQEINPECDLYFKIVYQFLDYAFRHGSKRISLGQTADSFKTRLGCSGSARHIYARGTGWLLSWVLRRCTGSLSPPRPIMPAHDVFKDTEVAVGRKERAKT
jgi:hypothetical protein